MLTKRCRLSSKYLTMTSQSLASASRGERRRSSHSECAVRADVSNLICNICCSDLSVLPGTMSPLFMMCKDGHLYERNHQVCCAPQRAPLSQRVVFSPCMHCSAIPQPPPLNQSQARAASGSGRSHVFLLLFSF